MLNTGFTQEQIEQAYVICKLQASVDGAFPEPLLLHWFQAAWELCAEMVDFIPPQEITEPIQIDNRGGFTLSHTPTSEVRIFAGYKLVAIIPPTLVMTPCDPGLCCFCNLTARYMIGKQRCEIPAWFIQAVARVFAYLVENRGDEAQLGAYGRAQGENILARCGALSFLSPEVTYAL